MSRGSYRGISVQIYKKNIRNVNVHHTNDEVFSLLLGDDPEIVVGGLGTIGISAGG